MNTPIVDFVNEYNKKNFTRFHMPGHKGKNFLGFEKTDITEIKGADELFSPEGIITESEENASKLFSSEKTLYSTEGSSLSIRAMVFLSTLKKKGRILASRNAHKAFLYAAALCDAEIQWLYPEKNFHLCTCEITKDDVEKALLKNKEISAVYITSPDYLGNILDIKGISKICKSFGVPLLVDNAHGAYLAFLKENLHPIHLGADLCCDSAHKTLPVLTGGGYLHIGKNACEEFLLSAKNAMSVFASTSPSYLILESLDYCNCYLASDYKERLICTVEKIKNVKEEIAFLGFSVLETEPLKITIDCKKSGYTGIELADILRKSKIECEYSDEDFLVLMISENNSDEDFEKLLNAFKNLRQKDPIFERIITPPKALQALSIRAAVFYPHEIVSVKDALNRICGCPTIACPPAVPIAVSGELITEEHIELFKKFKISKIEVVKT